MKQLSDKSVAKIKHLLLQLKKLDDSSSLNKEKEIMEEIASELQVSKVVAESDIFKTALKNAAAYELHIDFILQFVTEFDRKIIEEKPYEPPVPKSFFNSQPAKSDSAMLSSSKK